MPLHHQNPDPPRGNTRPKRQWLFAIAFLFLLLAALVIPAVAWARAGGGEGFKGPDGPGGGDGGGGSGSGGIIYLIIRFLIMLCVDYPAIGIPVTLVVIVGAVILYMRMQPAIKGVQAGEFPADSDDSDSPPSLDPAGAVALLQQLDPGFDEDAFLERVKNAFVKVQAAWSAQDLGAIRPFVSDGIVERFGLQFQEQKDAGYRNNMEKVGVLGSAVVQAAHGTIFDAVTVRIAATAIDYKTSLADGKVVAGDRAPQTFVEYWTFLRRAGASSLKAGKPGLIEGNCPNCGASVLPAAGSSKDPAELGGSAKCRSCGSVLRSGVHDWVLATIAQESVFRPRSQSSFSPTIESYQLARDKGFCPEQLEDRTSVIFWRLAKAQRLGKGDPLAKAATPEFREAIAVDATVHTDPKGRRTYFGKCAVGSVSALGVIPGPEFDRAFVRIEYSGARIAAPVAGAGKPKAGPLVLPGGGAAPGYKNGIMTLVRKTGAKSDPGLGLSSAHCPGCGAPQSDETADACAYCGYVTTQSTDWVVKTMDEFQSPSGREILAALAGAGVKPAARSPSPEEGPA